MYQPWTEFFNLSRGTRKIPFSLVLDIEKEEFMEGPPAKFSTRD